MPRAEILKEMQPNGILREEIKALIQEKRGIYYCQFKRVYNRYGLKKPH